MMRKRYLICVIVVCMMVSLALFACGSDGGTEEEPEDTIKIEDLLGFDVAAAASTEIGETYTVSELSVTDGEGNGYFVTVKAYCGETEVNVVNRQVAIDSFTSYKVTYTVTAKEKNFSKSTTVSVTDETDPVIQRGALNLYFGEAIDVDNIVVTDNSGESIDAVVMYKTESTGEYVTVEGDSFVAPTFESGVKSLFFKVIATDSHGNETIEEFEQSVTARPSIHKFTEWENLTKDSLSVSGDLTLGSDPAGGELPGAATQAILSKEITTYADTGITGLEITLPSGIKHNTTYTFNLSSNALLTSLNENFDLFETVSFVFKSSVSLRLNGAGAICGRKAADSAYLREVFAGSAVDANGFTVWTVDIAKLKSEADISPSKLSLTLQCNVLDGAAASITDSEETIFLAGVYGGFKDITANTGESIDLRINGFDSVTAVYSKDGGEETSIDSDDLSAFSLNTVGSYTVSYTVTLGEYTQSVIHRRVTMTKQAAFNEFIVWENLTDTDVMAKVRKDNNYATDANATQGKDTDGEETALKLTAPSALAAASSAPLIFNFNLGTNSAKLTAFKEYISVFQTITIELKTTAPLSSSMPIRATASGKTWLAESTEDMGGGWTRYTFTTKNPAGAEKMAANQCGFLINLNEKNTTQDEFIYIGAVYGGYGGMLFDGTEIDLPAQLGIAATELSNVAFTPEGESAASVPNPAAFAPAKAGTLSFSVTKDGYKAAAFTIGVEMASLRANQFTPWGSIAATDVKTMVRKNNNYAHDADSVGVIENDSGKNVLKLTALSAMASESSAALGFKIDLGLSTASLKAYKSFITAFETITIEVKASVALAATPVKPVNLNNVPPIKTEVLANGYTAYTFPVKHASYTNGTFSSAYCSLFVWLAAKNTDADAYVYVGDIYGGFLDSDATVGDPVDLSLSGFTGSLTATYSKDGGEAINIPDLTSFEPDSAGSYKISYLIKESGYFITTVNKTITVTAP